MGKATTKSLSSKSFSLTVTTPDNNNSSNSLQGPHVHRVVNLCSELPTRMLPKETSNAPSRDKMRPQLIAFTRKGLHAPTVAFATKVLDDATVSTVTLVLLVITSIHTSNFIFINELYP